MYTPNSQPALSVLYAENELWIIKLMTNLFAYPSSYMFCFLLKRSRTKPRLPRRHFLRNTKIDKTIQMPVHGLRSVP